VLIRAGCGRCQRDAEEMPKKGTQEKKLQSSRACQVAKANARLRVNVDETGEADVQLTST
jgi:hypothetical protein